MRTFDSWLTEEYSHRRRLTASHDVPRAVVDEYERRGVAGAVNAELVAIEQGDRLFVYDGVTVDSDIPAFAGQPGERSVQLDIDTDLAT
jgi:hypothetical protein